MRCWAVIGLGWTVFYFAGSACHAADRVALVIGNARYAGAAALDNPANDADTIAEALQDLDFQVTKRKDLNLEQMQDALVDFRRALPKGSLALFYYAGHGLQLHGENYLVPVGAKLREEFEVKHQSLHIDQVLDAMSESDSNLKVVVLDCCRNNPFTRSWKRDLGDRGLAAIKNIPDGTLIAFSTAPGKLADDGDGKKGKNSPYAAQLATVLHSHPEEGLELVDVFRESSRQVKRATGQVPWLNMEGSLEKYYLRPALDHGKGSKPGAPNPPAKDQASMWDLPKYNRPAGWLAPGLSGASTETIWLGAMISTPTAQQAKEANLPRRAGVVVFGIFPGGPLDQAAIVPGDLIVKLGDEWINQPQDVLAALAGRRAGDDLAMAFAHGGERHDVSITLQPMPSKESRVEMLRKLSKQGQVWAQHELGRCYLYGRGVVKDDAQGAAWVRKAAEAGNASAQAGLADLLLSRGGPQNDAEALVWARKAADQQDSLGQIQMGYLFGNGRAVPQDFQQAMAWYQKSADQGDPRAEYQIGGLYYHGKGVPQNYGTAAEWYQRAADHGDSDSQNDLGVMFQNGQGVTRDSARAVQYYRLAAEQRHILGMRNLGVAYRDGELVAQNVQEALKWLKEAASQGDADANLSLGSMYAQAQGVPHDYPQARKYFLEAAKLGSATGQFEVGLMTSQGLGVKKDYDAAMTWFRKAAEQGLPEAYHEIGRAYEFGWGVPQNNAQAVKNYHEAAKKGLAVAQDGLGLMILKGQGVKKDYQVARAWFELAAKQGESDALYNIGVIYESGWGVAADRAKAISFYQRAAEKGSDLAKEALRDLGEGS